MALQDEVSLSLSLHIGAQTKRDLEAEGKTMPEHPGNAVLTVVGEQQGRNAAHIGGRDRRAGGQLHAAVGRRHQHVHARRRDGDVGPVVGAAE